MNNPDQSNPNPNSREVDQIAEAVLESAASPSPVVPSAATSPVPAATTKYYASIYPGPGEELPADFGKAAKELESVLGVQTVAYSAGQRRIGPVP